MKMKLKQMKQMKQVKQKNQYQSQIQKNKYDNIIYSPDTYVLKFGKYKGMKVYDVKC